METLTMSRQERRRLELCGRVKREELSLVKAAELAGLSYRQMKRVYRRYREESDRGLVHRLRGRPSNRGGDPQRREQALTMYRERYHDFGPTLAAEYLVREHQLQLGVETLRRWLIQAGLWHAKQKRSVHRKWRERKEHAGEMVQMDGSHHDWFEGRREWACLMVMIDDATNFTYAQFFEEETTVAAMSTFKRYVEQHGLPRSLYVDRYSIYETTRDATADEELAETGPLTQFGRAMQELEVTLILAHSPQAKGRVERRNAVFQDRLVKALRLAGISDLRAANEFLEATFLPELNRQFNVKPKRKADVHRSVPRNVQLPRVLSFQEQRVVQNDWTVTWRHRRFQLTAVNQKLALVRQRVLVCEQLDGTLSLVYRGRELEWEEIHASCKTAEVTPVAKGPIAVQPTGHQPAPTHPWRRPFKTPITAAARPPCSASVAALPARSKAGGKQKRQDPNPLNTT
jgi:molybdenum-dependent DNA-binding transcriptional regulator ModE